MMGEIADAMLSGLFCAECGAVFDDMQEPGYPRFCCEDDPTNGCRPPAGKVKTEAQRERARRKRQQYKARKRAKLAAHFPPNQGPDGQKEDPSE